MGRARSSRAAALALVAAAAVLAATDPNCPSSNTDINSLVSVCAAGIYCANTAVCSTVGTLMKNCSRLVNTFYLTGCPTAVQAFSSSITAAQAVTLCNSTMSSFVTEACFPPVCPDYQNLTPLIPLALCLVTVPSQLQQSGGDINSYNAYACLQNSQKTSGVPSQCQPGNVVSGYQHCATSTQDVINGILGINDTSTQVCGTSILIGSLKKYCSEPFGQALTEFCTPTFCQTQFLSSSLTMCTGIGIVVGAVGGVVILAGVAIFVRRRRQRSQDNQLVPLGGSNPNMYSPGGSQHSGLSGGASGRNGGFAPAYHGSGSFMSPFKTLGAHGIPVAKPIVSLEQRKQELMEFYKEKDPEKTREQVDAMFDRYDFEQICRAIKSKYGVLPTDWPEEEAATNKADAHAGLAVLGVRVAKKDTGGAKKVKANTAKKYAKYNQMAKIGLDENAIRQAMERDGVDAKDWVYAPDG